MPLERELIGNFVVEKEMDVLTLRFFDKDGKKRLGSCQVIVTGFTSIRVKSLTFNNVLTSDLIKGLFDFALKHGYTTIEYERKRGDSFVYRKIDLTKHNNKPC